MTMLWAYLLLGENISANMVIGLLIIFAGVYLKSAKANKKKYCRTNQV
ncbi:MAG: hypothetical protein ACQEWV_01600 [Bacillota bacterium]